MMNSSTALSTGLRLALVGLCLFGIVFSLPALVRADKGNLTAVKDVTAHSIVQAPLSITLGKADLIEVDGDVSDVLVANPEIVDVKAIQANKLYVVGLQVGDTNLIALDAEGNVVKKLDLHVKYDLQAIQSLVQTLYPDEDVKVSSIHDQILLTGEASTPAIGSKIASVVGHYVGDLQNSNGESVDELISNLLDVRGEQQVMLKVKIIEASRSVLKELGVQTDVNDPDELAVSTIFGADPSSSINAGESLAFGSGAGLALSQDPTGTLRGIANTGIRGIGDIGLLINALEERNLVNVLAEPNLTAVSGETAGFLAGGEFPVPAGRDNIGNIVIEFREFGVSLNFKPVVLSGDRISLNMNTEVSSLDFTNAVRLDDLVVPGLDVRRAETTVEIGSGGSLMIAGLLQSQAVKGMAGLPGISDTPVLGDLVKSNSFQRDETELVVIITPYLVQSYADTEQAEIIPKAANNPLAKSFAANIRRSFPIKNEDELFDQDERFGYILD